MDAQAEYERGNELVQRLVRGDALIGLVADIRAMEDQILAHLWASARAGHAPAYRVIAVCALAVLQPIGAFEGIVDAQADERPWSVTARAIREENPQLQTGLRALLEASRTGDHSAAIPFARWCRHSTAENQRTAVALLRDRPEPSGSELYTLGNVLLWLGEREESATIQRRAADMGNLDAQFELSIYYGQGIGLPPDAVMAQAWLDRAADGGHPRALYNLGAAYASGLRGAPDLGGAAKFYERAAAAGSGQAAATLGVMILTGEISRLPAEAARWLNRSDDLGFPSREFLVECGLEDPRDKEDAGTGSEKP